MAVLAKLIRRFAKTTAFFAIAVIIGRTIGDPQQWFDHDLARRIGHFIYGPGEIGADNFYELYTYISMITVFSITTVIYIVTMKLINKIRNR